MARCRRAGASIDELHDLAAVHVPVRVGVRREHRLRHDRLRGGHGLRVGHGCESYVAGDRSSLAPKLLAMSVLSREELRAALAGEPPLVEGLDQPLQLQPNGIDLRVDRVQRLTSPGLLGASDQVREPAAREDVAVDKDGWWDLHRGAYVITYQEKVNLPTRSEERRVGKECRSRWSPDH